MTEIQKSLFRAARRGLLFLVAAFLSLIHPGGPVHAGDYAERQILGFSPDGHYFAFEQFGVQDGSGFPYADIFVIDTGSDSWVGGSPFRVLIKDERATVKWARRDALAKAGNLLRKLVISAPGTLLASNPPSELSADPHKVTVNARFVIPAGSETWTFTLAEIPFKDARCTDLTGEKTMGFSLSGSPHQQPARQLHTDTAIPKSRGCPLNYAISDVIMHEPEKGARVFAVLVSVFSFGFEGPDRRFIAVTHAAN